MTDNVALPHDVIAPPIPEFWPIAEIAAACTVIIFCALVYGAVARYRYAQLFRQRQLAYRQLARIFAQATESEAHQLQHQANMIIKHTASHYYGNWVNCLYGDDWLQFLQQSIEAHGSASRSQELATVVDSLYNPRCKVDVAMVYQAFQLWLDKGLPAFDYLRLTLRPTSIAPRHHHE